MTQDATPKPLNRHHFASDNYAGICPEVWEAMAKANRGHAAAYGEDDWTHAAADLIRELFETDCEVFFTFNGTAANSLALASLCQSYNSILCHELAHIETDECGGPEFFSNGAKLLLIPGANGKIDVAGIDDMVLRRTDIHYPKPGVVTVTQATEAGTIYTPEELSRIGAAAKKHHLHFHMDGARFANAVATLAAPPKELTWKVGVDVLCFGAVKNGSPCGEAVVFFDRALAAGFDYRCKQAGQLASKMRFLTAPWVGLLETGCWLRNAQHANEAALRLERELARIPTVEILAPVQANAVFVRLPERVEKSLREKGWRFYTFIGAGGGRFMCSWDTTQDDVRDLVSDIREAVDS